MAKPKDITGVRFGKLVAVEMLDKSNHYGRWWRCVCDCGAEIDAQPYTLNRGSVTSCGCTKNDNRIAALTTHGQTGSPTWITWQAMRQRCNNPKSKDFPKYGARGVSVCDDWNGSFESFLADMGERPDGTTIDRIDPNGNYTPENCRWANDVIQGNNKRRVGQAKSSHAGVRFNKARGKWIADHGKKRIGTFSSKEAAIEAKTRYMRAIGLKW